MHTYIHRRIEGERGREMGEKGERGGWGGETDLGGRFKLSATMGFI